MGSGCSSHKALQLADPATAPGQPGTTPVFSPRESNVVENAVKKLPSSDILRSPSITPEEEESTFFSKDDFITPCGELIRSTIPITIPTHLSFREVDIVGAGEGSIFRSSRFSSSSKENARKGYINDKIYNSFDSEITEEDEEDEEIRSCQYLEMSESVKTTQPTTTQACMQQLDIKREKTCTSPSLQYTNKRKDSSDSTQISSSRKMSSVMSNYSNSENPWLDALEDSFFKFAKFGSERFGEVHPNLNEMKCTSWAKLCKDCGFVDNLNIVTGDVDLIFTKYKLPKQRAIDFESFMKCLDEIADRRYGSESDDPMGRREIVYRRVIGKSPDLTGATEVSRGRSVRRMTDHNLYPIVHKLRFNETERRATIRRDSIIKPPPLTTMMRRTSLAPSEASSDLARSLSASPSAPYH